MLSKSLDVREITTYNLPHVLNTCVFLETRRNIASVEAEEKSSSCTPRTSAKLLLEGGFPLSQKSRCRCQVRGWKVTIGCFLRRENLGAGVCRICKVNGKRAMSVVRENRKDVGASLCNDQQ